MHKNSSISLPIGSLLLLAVSVGLLASGCTPSDNKQDSVENKHGAEKEKGKRADHKRKKMSLLVCNLLSTEENGIRLITWTDGAHFEPGQDIGFGVRIEAPGLAQFDPFGLMLAVIVRDAKTQRVLLERNAKLKLKWVKRDAAGWEATYSLTANANHANGRDLFPDGTGAEMVISVQKPGDFTLKTTGSYFESQWRSPHMRSINWKRLESVCAKSLPAVTNEEPVEEQ
jgi:hypothetical protein